MGAKGWQQQQKDGSSSKQAHKGAWDVLAYLAPVSFVGMGPAIVKCGSRRAADHAPACLEAEDDTT